MRLTRKRVIEYSADALSYALVRQENAKIDSNAVTNRFLQSNLILIIIEMRNKLCVELSDIQDIQMQEEY